MTSGIERENNKAQWSEKGKGAMSQDDTDETQEYGQSTRSMQDASWPSHQFQVKLVEVGRRYLQMSVTQHESKRRVKARVLSLDVSSAEEPKRLRARSKTVLKSQHKTVGMAGSTASEILLKNRPRLFKGWITLSTG